MSCGKPNLQESGSAHCIFFCPVAYTGRVSIFDMTGNNRLWRQSYTALVILIGSLLCPPAISGELVPFPENPETPLLKLPDLSGQQHNISDYAGKVVLVNFWASWCQPCLYEMPSMQRLHEAMHGRPFSILAVDVEESKSKVWRFKKLLNISFTTLLDSKGKAMKDWDARILPTSYLIDSEGRMRYGVRGTLEWDSDEVKALIETLMPKQEAAVQATLYQPRP
jgi:thiol-disulfide isomerase/thioredoxin